jgi:hypothetical protein
LCGIRDPQMPHLRMTDAASVDHECRTKIVKMPFLLTLKNPNICHIVDIQQVTQTTKNGIIFAHICIRLKRSPPFAPIL